MRKGALTFGLLAALLFAPLAAPAAEPGALTEEEALRRSMNREAVVEFQSGRIGVAQADAVEAGLWPNPTVSYTREQVNGDPAETDEDFAWLTQRFDLSGRRGLRHQAAELRIGAAKNQLDAWLLDLTGETRRRFYQVLLHQQRLGAAERWTTRMRSITEIVARRKAAGDASAYDHERLKLELATARAQTRTAEAELERSRRALSALLGEQAPAAVIASGTLLPATAPLPLQELLALLPERADLRALEQQVQAAEREGTAAGRWWAPQVNLGGGVKTVKSQTGRSTGFLVNFSVPLPVFDRNQDEAVRASSEARISRAKRRLELSDAEGTLQGLWMEATTVAEAAREFRRDAVAPSGSLLRTARKAYESGETAILQLLDAYRSAFNAETRALDLEWRARQTRISLDRAAGQGKS